MKTGGVGSIEEEAFNRIYEEKARSYCATLIMNVPFVKGVSRRQVLLKTNSKASGHKVSLKNKKTQC